MIKSKNSTATKQAGQRWLTLLGCWLALSSTAWAAQVAGTVTQLSGPLLDKKGDGTVKILSLKSEVESGDTLVTEKNTYALVKFIDNSEITLKPGTTFKIENFAFDEGKPGGDSAAFNLVKGGLRSVTGLLGKRNKEKFEMKTPSATIGIRGTTFIAEWVEPTAAQVAAADEARMNFLLASTAGPDQAMPVQPLQQVPPPNAPPVIPLQSPPTPVLPAGGPALQGPAGPQQPGLYVQVIDGLISVSNPAGSQVFQAGQFGFTPSFKTPPVIIPQNPGLKFSPPPVFNSSTAPTQGSTPPKSNAVDCEVR
jgi:hypothetical protein